MQQRWIRFVFPMAIVVALALPAAAQEEESEPDEAPYGLGPLEMSPVPLIGNVGAPRSAVPETRFGVLLHWLMQSQSTPAGDISGHLMSLVLEAHLELLDVLEVGVDVEALQYAKVDVPTGSLEPSPDYADFGFVTPRVKFAFLRGDMYTLSFGFGVALPTGSSPRFDNNTPIALDPGLYFALRLLDMISINLSCPVSVFMDIPSSGSTSYNTFIMPTAGITVMPIDFIGGVLDLQFNIWADPDEGSSSFNAMNLLIGARSNFLPWIMAELGAIIPLAGDVADVYDFGLGFRIVATPDFL